MAGAHGDRISLGKTVLVLEREGGPEPPPTAAQRRRYVRQQPGGGVVEVAADGSRKMGAAAAVGAGGGGAAARGKHAPAVISKGFAANPNLVRMPAGVHVRVFFCRPGVVCGRSYCAEDVAAVRRIPAVL